MKTRPVIKFVLMMSIATSVISCKEEEFYEKEYIQTIQEDYEDSIVEDLFDPASTTGDDGSGSTTGDDGSGSTTGDDGSGSTTGDDGSGSTTGDDGSGSTTGDDGSGSTTGDDGSGSTTGDDGSGSTTGDDGSGSTTGDDGSGSTTGDDGSGSTTGDNGGGDVTYEPVMDTFSQSASGQNKVDILWVVDNSGSMREEQQQLAYNFDIFINKFIEKDIDFKMSITTTDTRSNNAGKPVKDSLTKLTSQKLAEDKDLFLENFRSMIQVGTNGWGREKGLWASEVFSNKFANHHFREDAYFVIVYVSDEEDQSPKSPAAHLKQIAKWKNNAGLVKAYSIVNMSAPYKETKYLVPGYERYKAMSDLTGGYTADIFDSFYNVLLDMGNNIAELSESFPLSQVPHDASALKVLVNGVEQVDGWEYDEQSRTIKFLPGYVPSPNAIINVAYEVES